MIGAPSPLVQEGSALETALAAITAGAGVRDAEDQPGFPEAAFAELERAGATTFNAVLGPDRPAAADELSLVRKVARADGSVGRIFDGHLNAVERLAVQGPPELARAELRAIVAGELRAGVWGGDPAPGEGEPATVRGAGRDQFLRGVKTFCSGAGGLHRALVLARSEAGGRPSAPGSISAIPASASTPRGTDPTVCGPRCRTGSCSPTCRSSVYSVRPARLPSSLGSPVTRCAPPLPGPAWPTPPWVAPWVSWPAAPLAAHWRAWPPAGF